jgi:hypothetical protein
VRLETVNYQISPGNFNININLIKPILRGNFLLVQNAVFGKWLVMHECGMRDFRLPPRCTWDLRSSGVSRSLRGGIKIISDWCRHLYSSCSTKHRSQQAKLWIPGSTAKFCGDCVKTSEDVSPSFGENRHGCFTMTMPRLTPPFSPSSFWRNNKWLSSPTHCTPLIWHPVTFFCLDYVHLCPLFVC